MYTEHESLYVRVRSGRGCCWWVWVCGTTTTVSSSALRWRASPGECTVGLACEALPSRSLPTQSYGTCSGSRPAEQHPSVRCTWPADQVLRATLWTTETCAYINNQVGCSQQECYCFVSYVSFIFRRRRRPRSVCLCLVAKIYRSR